MHTLYSMQASGNCYKLRLAMAQLGVAFRLVDVDTLKGETRTPAFLAMNANGKIPLLKLESGEYLPESNAALFYLAEGSALIPDDRLHRARMLQWMFFEQYSHEPYIAVARMWRSYVPGGLEEKAEQFPEWEKNGYQALDVMEEHLSTQPYFAREAYCLADIALYAYTHMANEGGFDLSRYPHIRRWLQRVADQPGHVPLSWRPETLER